MVTIKHMKTHLWLRMKMSLSFNELEPIYHDDYSKLDNNTDRSIGF